MLAQTAQKIEMEELSKDAEYIEKLNQETLALLRGKPLASQVEQIVIIDKDGTRRVINR